MKTILFCQISKVGPGSTTSSSTSLFYLTYRISTSSTSDYIMFTVPGLSNISILRSLTTTGWQRFKVEHRLSGNSCLTILHIGGTDSVTTEIYNNIHDCGSYTVDDTHVYAPPSSGGYQAIGWVDEFHFVWL